MVGVLLFVLNQFVFNSLTKKANCALVFWLLVPCGKPKTHKHIHLHFARGQLVARRCVCGKASCDLGLVSTQFCGVFGKVTL